VIARGWRAATRRLRSPKLAVCLLAFIGVWSLIATAVPQGGPSAPAVAEWASEHTRIDAAVRAVGLHEAFSSPLFIAAAILLGLSTAVCSWDRTKVAIARARSLRSAASATQSEIARDKRGFAIPCGSARDESEALGIASETLSRLDLRVREQDGVLTSLSKPWTVWGSAVFHWALFVLFAAAFGGMLVRVEGSVAVPVGDTVSASRRASFVTYDAGPLSQWRSIRRSVRVDAFDPNYELAGIDRGAVPTVSLLDTQGNVLVTQRVYPNKMLHNGSLSISAPGCGLAVDMVLINPSGAEVSRYSQMVRFSQEASTGTAPLNTLVLKDASGGVALRMVARVPLDRSGGGFGEWIPSRPRAIVRVQDGSGQTLLDSVVPVGGRASIKGGGTVEVADIGWYSRLALVDDPTIPLVYASMVVAILGLAVSLTTRQQLVVVACVDNAEGLRLIVDARMWRNAPVDRDELRDALSRALEGDEEGTPS